MEFSIVRIEVVVYGVTSLLLCEIYSQDGTHFSANALETITFNAPKSYDTKETKLYTIKSGDKVVSSVNQIVRIYN